MIEYVEATIKTARFEADPWLHLVMPNFFPDDEYKAILANLPTPEQMERLNMKMSTRYLYWLYRKDVAQPVTPFWQRFCTLLFDPLRSILQDKFGVTGGFIAAELLHDYKGYYIGPHTDTANKLVTGLIYLPETSEHANLGTILYKGQQPDPSGKGHKLGPEYQRVKRIPYVPNTALFFERTDWSYHGVEPSTHERWLLAFDLYR